MEVSAERVQVLNTDSRLKPEREQTYPIEKNQQANDICFTPIFLILFSTWLTYSSLEMFLLKKAEMNEAMGYIEIFINAPITKFSALLPISLFVAMVIIICCLILYEKLTNSCIYISTMIITVSLISSFFSFLIPKHPKEQSSILNILLLTIETHQVTAILILIYYMIYVIPYALYMIISAISFFKVDIRILRDITRDSCRFIQSSPLLLIFASLISIMGFLVISFTVNALLSNPYNVFITIAGGICTLEFIVNFARMVISEYTMNAFYMKDEKVAIGPIIMKTLRNSMGTAMLASTMFVSLNCSIIQALKHKPTWRIKESYIFYIVTKITLTTNPDTALAFSAIYGTGFFKSHQKTFDVILRNPKIYMAMQLVTQGVFVIILLSLIIPMAVMLAVGMIISRGPQEDVIKNISIIVYGFSYTVFVYGLLITSITKAHLINKILILNKEDHDNSREEQYRA